MTDEYPKSVLTKGRSGRVEVRCLVSRGRYILCEYLDIQTCKVDDKKKIILKNENGNYQEFFIIPMKASNKYLLIKPKEKSDIKKQKVWNREKNREEKMFS